MYQRQHITVIKKGKKPMPLQKFSILFVLLSTLSIFGGKKPKQKIVPFLLQELPQELVPVIISKLNDIQTMSHLSRTCKEYQKYCIKKILGTVIPDNIWVPHLTSTQHTNTLIHYAQQSNEKMINNIIENETMHLKLLRSNILVAFNFHFPVANDISPIKKTIHAYQGQYEEHIQPNNHFYKAVTHANNHELLILLKNFPNHEQLYRIERYTHDTLLIKATLAQFLDIVKLLLTHCPALINKQNRKGNTALHYACCANNIELVKIFLQYKCNLNIQNKRGKTPLHCSSRTIAQLLLQHKANKSIKDKCGKTGLEHLNGKK